MLDCTNLFYIITADTKPALHNAFNLDNLLSHEQAFYSIHSPCLSTRKRLFRYHIDRSKGRLDDDEDLDWLASKTEGVTVDEIGRIVQDATLQVLLTSGDGEHLRFSKEDFKNAMEGGSK